MKGYEKNANRMSFEFDGIDARLSAEDALATIDSRADPFPLALLKILTTARKFRAMSNVTELVDGQWYRIELLPQGKCPGPMAWLEYKQRLEQLSALVTSGNLGAASAWNAPHMVAISFGQHLYYPLLSPEKDAAVPLKMRPLAISEPSEIQFVQDVMAFYESAAGKAQLRGYSLYLLRNADHRSKGLGFALAGNFYPDFMLWLVDDHTGRQWLSFIDPKGIRNLNLSDPKFGLYKEIKTIESALSDPAMVLNAFVLSITSFSDLINVPDSITRSELEDRHVLFMDDGGHSYLTKLISKTLSDAPVV